jgi:hypothetical protein
MLVEFLKEFKEAPVTLLNLILISKEKSEVGLKIIKLNLLIIQCQLITLTKIQQLHLLHHITVTFWIRRVSSLKFDYGLKEFKCGNGFALHEFLSIQFDEINLELKWNILLHIVKCLLQVILIVILHDEWEIKLMMLKILSNVDSQINLANLSTHFCGSFSIKQLILFIVHILILLCLLKQFL